MLKGQIFLLIKGFILGVANVIPGVSGGTIAITLGIYEKLLSCIGGFFKNFKENIKFLLPLGVGLILAILTMSKFVGFTLDRYPFQTVLFFVGLILGGIKPIIKKVKKSPNLKNFILFTITFAFVFVIKIFKNSSQVDFTNMYFINYLLLFFVGVVAAVTMIIPGISGSFVLMLIGYYEPVINTIGDLTNFSHLGHNILILVPFGLGAVVGIVLLSKILTSLFKKHEIPLYYMIFGFIASSVINIVLLLDFTTIDFVIILTSIITFIWGFLVATALERESK